jgi:hypothetical protein
MRRGFSRYDLGDNEISIDGGGRVGYDFTCRNLAHAQHNIRDEIPSGHRVEFLKECRLQECELMQPNTVVDEEIEFLVADLVRPGVRRNGFPDDGDPIPAQAVFEQLGLETQAASHPFENAGERIDGTRSTHGGIIAKAAVACSNPRV